MSSLEAAPLGDRAAISTHALLALAPTLGPASRRVLPLLLPPVDREVKQSVAVVHRLDAAPGGPVRLENLGYQEIQFFPRYALDVEGRHTGTGAQRGSRHPRLERKLSDLVNAAYGLTAEEVALLGAET